MANPETTCEPVLQPHPRCYLKATVRHFVCTDRSNGGLS
jgi:hypothetical protein